MKRLLSFAAAATVLFAACQKTEVVYDNPDPQEIALFAVNKVATKAPVEGTAFPDVTMKAAAYLAAGDGVTTGRNYFGGADFTDTGDYWTGGQYWPISAATINFLAVAPEVTGVATTFPTTTNYASHSQTVVTGNETNQHDVMYSTARASKNAGSAPAAVNMTFKHAYSWLDFNFKKSTGAPEIVINSITVNGVACNGTLTVTVTNAGSSSDALTTSQAWSSYTPAALTVPKQTSKFELTTSFVEYEKGILLIPEKPFTSFVINYTIADQTFDYTYTPTTLTWAAGKRYVYNITMSPSLISINPTLEAWDGDSTDSNDDDNDSTVGIN